MRAFGIFFLLSIFLILSSATIINTTATLDRKCDLCSVQSYFRTFEIPLNYGDLSYRIQSCNSSKLYVFFLDKSNYNKFLGGQPYIFTAKLSSLQVMTAILPKTHFSIADDLPFY